MSKWSLWNSKRVNTNFRAILPEPTNNGTQGPDFQGLQLQGGNSTALAQEVCPGCTVEVIKQKLQALQNNRQQINTCQAPADTAVVPGPGTEAGAVDPTTGEVAAPADEAKRQEDIKQIKNRVMGATQPKQLCSWKER